MVNSRFFIWVSFFFSVVSSLNQSEYASYWSLLADPYGRTLAPSDQVKTQTRNPLSRRPFALQMTRTNQLGLPKCRQEPQECQTIGIVGAGQHHFHFSTFWQQNLLKVRPVCTVGCCWPKRVIGWRSLRRAIEQVVEFSPIVILRIHWCTEVNSVQCAFHWTCNRIWIDWFENDTSWMWVNSGTTITMHTSIWMVSERGWENSMQIQMCYSSTWPTQNEAEWVASMF